MKQGTITEGRTPKGLAAFALKGLVALALAACATTAFAGCSAQEAGSQGGAEQPQASSSASDGDAGEGKADISGLRVVSMKGPTSVGLAAMMQQDACDFTVVASADEAAPLLLQGNADIACVPANLAATLYQKTGGALQVIDVNTLGVLNVVTADASVDSVAKLAGRTVYMTGKGTVPEYTLSALLAKEGMSIADLDVQFKSEPAEVVAQLAAAADAVGILPQPYATAATTKDPSLQVTLDLTKAWEQASGEDGGTIVTGVAVAKREFVEQNAGIVDAFLAAAAASATTALDDPASVAPEVVAAGIIDNEKLAEAAIPHCSVVLYTGDLMKQALSDYLAALHAQNPASVGGELPGDDFYYIGEGDALAVGASS